MRALVVASALIAAAAAPVHASVWSDASGDELRAEAHDTYVQSMLLGDDSARAATTDKTLSLVGLEKTIDTAIDFYQKAAAANPNAGEPYIRIATLVYSFYFDSCGDQSPNPGPLCPPSADPDIVNRQPRLHARALQLLAAWDAFEARAPLDPRIDRSFLFERAILHTKLGTHDDLVAAARDYEANLRRYGFDGDRPTINNLAETYMMLGRLDDAIEMYRRAVANGADDAVFGLAVALDRDERPDSAREIILEAGTQTYMQFVHSIDEFKVFFVPPEEKFYYLALCEEAYDDIDHAILHWQAFLTSGVYPIYQPRAQAHLDHLLLQRRLHPQILRPRPAYDPFEE